MLHKSPILNSRLCEIYDKFIHDGFNVVENSFFKPILQKYKEIHGRSRMKKNILYCCNFYIPPNVFYISFIIRDNNYTYIRDIDKDLAPWIRFDFMEPSSLNLLGFQLRNHLKP